METLLPRWVMKRYLLLNHQLGSKRNKEFTFKDVEEALSKIGDDQRIVALFLSELRKAKWLTDEGVSPEDARRRVYKLRNYENIFNDIVAQMIKNKK